MKKSLFGTPWYKIRLHKASAGIRNYVTGKSCPANIVERPLLAYILDDACAPVSILCHRKKQVSGIFTPKIRKENGILCVWVMETDVCTR